MRFLSDRFLPLAFISIYFVRCVAFRRPAEVEEHLGSPISSLGDADSVGSLNGTVSVNDTTKTVRGK